MSDTKKCCPLCGSCNARIKKIIKERVRADGSSKKIFVCRVKDCEYLWEE